MKPENKQEIAAIERELAQNGHVRTAVIRTYSSEQNN